MGEACFVFGILELKSVVEKQMGETGVWSWIGLDEATLKELPKAK